MCLVYSETETSTVGKLLKTHKQATFYKYFLIKIRYTQDAMITTPIRDSFVVIEDGFFKSNRSEKKLDIIEKTYGFNLGIHVFRRNEKKPRPDDLMFPIPVTGHSSDFVCANKLESLFMKIEIDSDVFIERAIDRMNSSLSHSKYNDIVYNGRVITICKIIKKGKTRIVSAIFDGKTWSLKKRTNKAVRS